MSYPYLNFIIASSLFSLLTGCAPMYQQPAPSAPAATINFNNNPNFKGLLTGVSIYKDPINCTGDQLARHPGFKDQVLRVYPNKLLTFGYLHHQYLGIKMGFYDYNICMYVISFTPQANKKYSVKVTEGTEINGKYSCNFSFYNETDKKPVKYTQRYHKDNMTGFEGFDQCDDVKQFSNQTT